MTILSVAQQLYTKIGIERPTAIYASTDRTMYALQNVIADAVTAIKEAHDWQCVKAIATFTGDGSATSFDLPDAYDRMLKTAQVWSSRYNWAMEHIVDSNRWLELITLPYTQVIGTWTIYGGQFHILDTMASGDTAKFFYMKDELVADEDGAKKAGFTADSDTFRLDEELLRTCIIYKWKQSTGQAYDEEMADFNILLNRAIDKDNGSKPVISGRPYRKAKVAWPGTVSEAP